MRYLIVSFFVAILSAFRLPVKMVQEKLTFLADTTAKGFISYTNSFINGVDAVANEFVDYAKTLIGTPYVWGSINPKVGVDCSGFVAHVAKQFNIIVPRTSAQYTHLGTEVQPAMAQTGDIILFTGSNAKSKRVGHMGIVTENSDSALQFIHSSSGKKRGVHISELTGYYKTRLVKIIRIFPLPVDKVLI